MVRARLAYAAMAALALGCGDGAETEPVPPPPPPATCAAGERSDDAGGCCAAGTTPMPGGGCCPLEGVLPEVTGCCPAGSLASDDGCIAAGIAPELCPQGFVPDGAQGCDPVLPSGPCPDGLMAIPGDPTCRAIAPCATGTWGDIPVDATTEHVDASYTGGASDGSALQPWTTVTDAVAAAAPAALVAIAAGTYPENVLVTAKPVRLHGRCPEMVSITGTSTSFATVWVSSGADDSELRGFAVTGVLHGVLVEDATGVAIEELWIHDTGGLGLVAQHAALAPSISVRGTLIEGATEIGILLLGATGTVEESVVREPAPQGLGRGVEDAHDETSGTRGRLTLRRSLIERNRDLGILVAGSDALVEGSVVRDTATAADGSFGRGMGIQTDAQGLERSQVTVNGALFENNRDLGIFVASSDVQLSAVVVRDTSIAPATGIGRGLGVQARSGGEPGGEVNVSSSSFSGNRDTGIFVAGSRALLEAVVVRDTQPLNTGETGYGVSVEADDASGAPGSLTVHGSLLEGNAAIGMLVTGCDAEVDNTVVRDTALTQSGLLGRGVHAQINPPTARRSSITMSRTIVERNIEVGVVVLASDAALDGCIVRDTRPRLDGQLGRGASVQTDIAGGRSVTTIAGTLFEQNDESGMFVVSSDATISDSVIRDSPGLPIGLFGDALVVGAIPAEAGITVAHVRIERSARAGISNFGGVVALERSVLECNPIDLNGETDYSFNGMQYAHPFGFEDRGANTCGCVGETHTCTMRSAGLTPPDALPP